MVGTAQPPPTTTTSATATAQQQQKMFSPSASSTSAAVGTTAAGTSASGEEEAYKKHTDCVYFLASPLTCKKGSECEYRHSDVARVNPRDCWYWLHGNCLNPKCGFRHPPLDGLFETQGPNPAGPTLPPSQPATTPASLTSGKQGVACIYFQRGHCLRGSWCSFVHAPNSINTIDNKAPHGQAAAIITEPPQLKKTYGGHERPTQEQKASQTNVPKSIDLLRQAKPMDKIAYAPVKNEISVKKKIPSISATDGDLQWYRSAVGTPVDDQNQFNWSNHVQQPVSLNEHRSMNDKDAEEVSREPSPAFDVLVDNELRESDYYHGEDQFERTVDHEGRREYVDGRSGDHQHIMVDADQDIYHESHGYDSHERLQGQYAREQRRSSSEKMLGGLSHPERRLHGRPESPEQGRVSDLRYRLSKHRRTNGLKSVISQDCARERYDDRVYQNPQREPHHDRARQESSFSSRLQGRIRIPGRSAADGKDLRFDRENEKGRDHSGSSHGRLQLSFRLRDRIKGSLQEDVNSDSRSNRGLRMGRDTVSDNNANFTGPKRLAELKSYRNFDRNDQHLNDQLLKRKFSKLQYEQQIGGDASFEGPKPLEEILKRKRGSGLEVSGSGGGSGDNEDATVKKSEESSIKTKVAEEKQTGRSLLSKNDTDLSNDDKNEHKTTSGVKDMTEGSLPAAGRSLNLHNVNGTEVEDGMIVENGGEEGQELENYEQGDDVPYYEQGDGEDYNLEEGDNGEPEEEYLDDDDDGDDDDFAKKMGVLY